ncbi:MAG: DNA-binding protein [Acidobacteria bacterium]|nr:MAG: DNA-binding protein [Acidobacteriota bacterium]
MATIAQLAEEMKITGEAVRQQLLQLHREGWVEATVEHREHARTGRPATTYRLSAEGDHLFPKHYDALAVAVIDAVTDEFGDEALLRVLARVADERVQSYAVLHDLPLAERVDALKNWYLADDPYMEVERVNGDFRLIERNCPFYNTAMRRPALCSVSINALTRLLGVRVEREEKFQNGDGRCVFRVHGSETADPNAPFALERSTRSRSS